MLRELNFCPVRETSADVVKAFKVTVNNNRVCFFLERQSSGVSNQLLFQSKHNVLYFHCFYQIKAMHYPSPVILNVEFHHKINWTYTKTQTVYETAVVSSSFLSL
jgi:hypothetical protein